MTQQTNRRNFLKTSAVAIAGLWAAGQGFGFKPESFHKSVC